MIRKYLICPERRRYVPRHFSWIDHRLVRDRHICRCSSDALALYLFLVVVGDADGLSYYSDSSIRKYLCIGRNTLQQARHDLIAGNLIAYEHPLYQVLCLDRTPTFNIARSLQSCPSRKPDDDNEPPAITAPAKPPRPPTPLAAGARVGETAHISTIIDNLSGRQCHD